MAATEQTLHYYILDTVKEDLLNLLRDIDQYNSQHPNTDLLLKVLFKNYRMIRNTPVGLRLTYTGTKLLKKHFNCYTYQYTGNVNHMTYILLDKHMSWPYYVGNSNVCFFSENDAAWFRLNGGDLVKFSEYV